MTGAVRVLVGTTKGAFVLDGNVDRTDWQIRGPFCNGGSINHVIGDPATGTIWAAGGNEWTGMGIWRSDDHGANWTMSDTGLTSGERQEPVAALWSLGRSGDVLYVGAKPASLYESRDRGDSWQKVDGLHNHPSFPDWEPGAAGLVLHSIVTDPYDAQKMWIGISAAGVFATEDGGKTWESRNRRSNMDAVHLHAADGHDHDSNDVGLCVHNIVRAPGDGSLMYQQNHHGAYRSPDGGLTWHSMEAGLPSTFGFPIAVHPHDPQTLWVFPLNGDSMGRFPPDASAAVWRSRDGGATWQAMQSGLPVKDCFFTVLRQAMAVDQDAVAGVYFGTNSGSVFASRDEGDSWTEIARHLPTILSVETVSLG